MTETLRSIFNGTLIAWGAIEIVRMIRSGRHQSTDQRDRLSAPLLFIGIWLGISTAGRVERLQLAPLPGPLTAYFVAGILLIWCGIALRAWSFASLGRLFTYRVTIQSGHHVVTSGPYRYMRHPSYTGGFLIVTGGVLTMKDVLSLAIALAAAAAVIGYRIAVEERELTSALGDDYRDYARHTKRLIPGVL